MLLTFISLGWAQTQPSAQTTTATPQLMDLMYIGPDMHTRPVMQISPKSTAPKRAVKRTTAKPQLQTVPRPIEKPKESPTVIPQILDSTHKVVSRRLSSLANQLDSFFGDKRADDELNRSSIRFAYSYRLRMEKKPLDDTQFRFNLRLPNLENKFKFSMKQNEKGDGRPTQVDNPVTPPALTRNTDPKEEKEPWRFRADTGINVGYPPIIFTRGRLRKNWNFPVFIQRFTEELAWISDQGFLQTTQIFHDNDLSETVLFRVANEQSWYINDKLFSTSHGPSILHTISDDDAISYNMRVQTRVNGPWYASNYSVGVSYRRNLRQQWLYGEIGPTLDFPKSESFRRSPSILLKLETLFGAKQ